jgi:acyl carrier protein
MPDDVAILAGQGAKDESIAAGCARIFRDIAGWNDSKTHYGWSDVRLLQEPLEAFDLDSLTVLQFVMAVEEAYNLELDEDDVNRCETIGDLVRLVAAARNGSGRL